MYVTVIFNHVFISFYAVQIYDLSDIISRYIITCEVFLDIFGIQKLSVSSFVNVKKKINVNDMVCKHKSN